MRTSRGRRRLAAIALLPLAALTISTQTTSAADQRQAAFKPGQKQVRFGNKIALRGSFPGSPNAKVDILFRRAGNKGFRRVAGARTNGNARWHKRVKPRASGAWRARLAAPEGGRTPLLGPVEDGVTPARQSRSKRVRVKSVTRVKTKGRHVVIGDKARIRGRVAPAGKRRVIVKVGGRKLKTRSNAKGRFSVRWKAKSTGVRKVRAKAKPNRLATGSNDRGKKIIAYRHAAASWYGPGFYGNRTACGQTLTSGMVGVAHKTMPCGTKLKLRHGGKTVNVRVIDRGPYAHGREFDLTQATKNKLGFGSTGTVLTSR